jgi:hypothetical protein
LETTKLLRARPGDRTLQEIRTKDRRSQSVRQMGNACVFRALVYSSCFPRIVQDAREWDSNPRLRLSGPMCFLYTIYKRNADVPRGATGTQILVVSPIFPEPVVRIELTAVVYKTTALPLSDTGRAERRTNDPKLRSASSMSRWGIRPAWLSSSQSLRWFSPSGASSPSFMARSSGAYSCSSRPARWVQAAGRSSTAPRNRSYVQGGLIGPCGIRPQTGVEPVPLA